MIRKQNRKNRNGMSIEEKLINLLQLDNTQIHVMIFFMIQNRI